jgi:hypothetical protein
MKLRLHGNSLRLRLNRTDIQQFQQTGIREEKLRFAEDSCLTYILEASTKVSEIQVEYRGNCIRILAPQEIAQEWARSSQIALSAGAADEDGPSVLIEKDFQCLHQEDRDENDDADSFPNPAALQV